MKLVSSHAPAKSHALGTPVGSMFVKLSLPSDVTQISDVKFSPLAQNHLLVSSWSDNICLYDCNKVETTPDIVGPDTTFETHSTPLSLLCNKPGSTYVGFLDGTIGEIDFENGKINNLCSVKSRDSSPINYVRNGSIDQNAIIATLIAGEVISIDPRQQKSAALFDAAGASCSPGGVKPKIFAMDTSQNNLTLGLSNNSVCIYDLRNLHCPQEKSDLGLKHQIRDIEAYPNRQGFAVSTIDGRILMECFSSDPIVRASSQFAFKCHRVYEKKQDIDYVYSVNSLAFHKSLGTLFTGGSDGAVCIWDVSKRKRMKIYPKFISNNLPESVVKIGLSSADDILAVATSDDSYLRVRASDNSLSHKSNYPAGLYVRYLDSTESMPRK